MFTVKTLNKIASVGTDRLDRRYFSVDDTSDAPDAIIVRSADMSEYNMNPGLKCIARAGAGYNNIPISACAEKGIVVFNTPGANANGVKELVICALLLTSRDIVGGISWVNSCADKGSELAALVEKQKSKFTGPEIFGKSLGIVGLGAVGYKVAIAAKALGMEIIGYDPFLSEQTVNSLAGTAEIVGDLDELYSKADYISLHLPMTADTKGMIDGEAIAKMKYGVRIVNIARGELVDDPSMLSALKSGKVSKYVTDFPNGEIAGAEGVIAIPHLGASTPESEDNCAIMAADQISELLLKGNIINSVNLPNISLELSGNSRVLVIRRSNVPLCDLLEVVGPANASADRTRGDYSVAIIDTDNSDGIADKLTAIEGVIRVITI